MSKYVIIYCHPYTKSFNHAILEKIIENLKLHHHKFEVIDVYKEEFNPDIALQN